MDLIVERIREKIREFELTKQDIDGQTVRIDKDRDKERIIISGESNSFYKLETRLTTLFGMGNNYIFRNATIKKNTRIKGGAIRTEEATTDDWLKKDTTLRDIVFIDETEFNGIIFENDFILLIEAADNASITFRNCVFKGKLKIRTKEYNPIEHGEIGSEIEKEELYRKEQYSKVKLCSLKFIDCNINKNEGNTPYFRVGYLHIENFELSNLRIPSDAEVNIGDCHFENFELSNLRNLGKFKIYKINVLPKEDSGNKNFQIDNASIGNADFQSIALSSFDEINIFDNIFPDIDYTDIMWGNHIKNGIQVGKRFKGSLVETAKQQDTYRVLKNVALKNNDAPQALKFYAKEMECHRELIKKDPDSTFQEKFILWFNYYTNNFGQSWFRPIILIFGFGFLFYIALLISLCLSPFDCSNWNKFVMFLNPIDGIDFADKCEWSNWSYFWGFSFRIIEGLLIYQAIQAFRRYSRKF